jgi:SAM-dependent methyltransferase
MPKAGVTRGYGLLEKFLSRKRARVANGLIPDRLRQGKILDIGCGTIPLFLSTTQFVQKFGLDPVVKENLRTNGHIILKKFDIEENIELPFQNDFFDVVTMLAVFEHIEPDMLVDVLKEVKRVLKKDGRFILTTPCPRADKLLGFMAKMRLVSQEEMNEHKGVYNKVPIAHFLDKAGFKRKNMKFGYFEFFLNNWAYVDK